MKLNEFAAQYQGKRELTDLDKIPVDIDLKEGTFNSEDGKELKYYYIEIDGYKYAIKSTVLKQMKEIIATRPLTKFFRFRKLDNKIVVFDEQ